MVKINAKNIAQNLFIATESIMKDQQNKNKEKMENRLLSDKLGFGQTLGLSIQLTSQYLHKKRRRTIMYTNRTYSGLPQLPIKSHLNVLKWDRKIIQRRVSKKLMLSIHAIDIDITWQIYTIFYYLAYTCYTLTYLIIL